jgi:GNAT superfamily N-acetyltransferase
MSPLDPHLTMTSDRFQAHFLLIYHRQPVFSSVAYTSISQPTNFQLLFRVMIKVDSQQHIFSVSDLRQRPEFFDTISSRIWQAWWKQRGFPLKYIAGRLREHLDANPIPFALVAHDGPTFKGSTLVIDSDMDDRPQYSPWVAALWVDAENRKQGVGAALIDYAARAAFAVGIGRVYLCATRINRNFYLKRSWTKIEEDVGEDLLMVMVRDRPVS